VKHGGAPIDAKSKTSVGIMLALSAVIQCSIYTGLFVFSQRSVAASPVRPEQGEDEGLRHLSAGAARRVAARARAAGLTSKAVTYADDYTGLILTGD
jgi:hypothetical protein